MANAEKALDWIESKDGERAARLEQVKQKNAELLKIKDQLAETLISEGLESKHPKMTGMNFSGQWKGKDVQVGIYAKVLGSELVQKKNNLPIYVNLVMGDYETEYLLARKPENSRANIKFLGEYLDCKKSDFCLGLSQVVEAIQGGQLTVIRE